MNAGQDYAKAKRQAQANANQTKANWRMFMYGGAWWIERCQWSDIDPAKNGIEIITPDEDGNARNQV